MKWKLPAVRNGHGDGVADSARRHRQLDAHLHQQLFERMFRSHRSCVFVCICIRADPSGKTGQTFRYIQCHIFSQPGNCRNLHRRAHYRYTYGLRCIGSIFLPNGLRGRGSHDPHRLYPSGILVVCLHSEVFIGIGADTGAVNEWEVLKQVLIFQIRFEKRPQHLRECLL